MILTPIFVVVFVLWQVRRTLIWLRQAKRGFDARVQASKLHLMDSGEQMKVFLTELDLVTPSQAFDEANRNDDTELSLAQADQLVARALQEKAAPSAPSLSIAPPAARSFGRRKVA